MTDTIHVKVDEDLEEIVPEFLKNRKQDTATIDVLLKQEDFDAIQIIGHSMKGAGASYGFAFISEIGKAIEAAAKAGSSDVILTKKAELLDFLDRVHIEFIRE